MITYYLSVSTFTTLLILYYHWTNYAQFIELADTNPKSACLQCLQQTLYYSYYLFNEYFLTNKLQPLTDVDRKYNVTQGVTYVYKFNHQLNNY